MALPIHPTEVTRRRLLLCRALYLDAIQQASQPQRSYRRIIAVISLDLANETLLKSVVSDLAAGKQPDREFDPLLQTARSAVAQHAKSVGVDPLPGEAGALEAHRVRNGAQHDGRAPSDEVLNDCRTHTRDFLRGAMALIWAIDFDTLAASQAITYDPSRARLSEAETLFASDDFLTACRKAKTGLDWAAYAAGESAIGHRFPSRLGSLRYSGFDSDRWIGDLAGTIEDELDALRKQTRRLTIGLDHSDQRRLVTYTGHRHGVLTSDSWSDPKEIADRVAAEWALAYCTEAILRLEERFGPLMDDD